jgi:hypothetical protein
MNRATTLTSTLHPDGAVDFDWNDYGRDVWYWYEKRDVTRGQGFGRFDLWAERTEAHDTPVLTAADNGHTFAYRVVPFAIGAQVNAEAPASNVVQQPIFVAPPAAPTGFVASASGPGGVALGWTPVSFPSDKVYYWVFRWDVTAGETEANAHQQPFPLGYTVTHTGITGLTRGHTYGFLVKAQNLGGWSVASNRQTVAVP